MKFLGIATFILVFSAVAMTACAGSSGNLEGTLWRMTSYQDVDGEMVETLPDVKTTAEFLEGQVSGNSACNTYNGSYEVDGNKINFGPMMSTMMACPSPIMEQESGYLAALDLVSTFEVKDKTLTMFNSEGRAVLTYEILEPTSLVGTNWQLTSYNNGKGGMQSVIIGSEITANFDEEGTMSGSAGCNSYTASYEATESSISIGIAASTEMACMEPEGVMEQESQYLATLQNSAVYSIRDDRLEIRDENGSGVAYFIVMP